LEIIDFKKEIKIFLKNLEKKYNFFFFNFNIF